MSNYSKNLIYLSDAQYQALVTDGSITVDNTTITYNEDDIYVTPQAEPYIKPVSGIPASDLASGVIPSVPVQDVQVNGTSILNNGVANMPVAGAYNLGVVKVSNTYGLDVGANQHANFIRIVPAPTNRIKGGDGYYNPVTTNIQHQSTFYGLAKAAGADMASLSSTTVGTYPEAQKAAIQNMLGITDLISTEESSTATAAHAINSTFMMNGKLHRATAAIAIGDAVEVGTNCEVVKADEVFVKNTDIATSFTLGVVKTNANYGTAMRSAPNQDTLMVAPAGEQNIKEGTQGYQPIVPLRQHMAVYYGLSKLAGVDLANETVTVGTYPETSKTAIRSLIGAAAVSDIPSVPVQDVQVNGSSILSQGVANIPMASSTPGVVKLDSAGSNGIGVASNGYLYLAKGTNAEVKSGTNQYKPIVPYNQDVSAFYGLAKAAGADMASSSNAVGTYTDSAKIAIRNMLGATSSNVIEVSDTQPTDTDNKIWLPETEPTGIEVPTYAEFQALDAAVVKKTDIASTSAAGIVKVNANYGTFMQDGTIGLSKALTDNIKGGTHQCKVIVPYNQHEAVFFGLSKAAGVDLASETVTLGTYPTTASAAIRSMLGAIGDVQVNGISIVNNGTANIPIAGETTLGVVKTYFTIQGVNVTGGTDIDQDGVLSIHKAESNTIKNGTNNFRPIVPSNQHEAVFYGLAKAAGNTDQSSSSNAVGTYTSDAKAKIQSMLGIETGVSLVETVSGTTPSITGQPNIRYMCGEVSTLSITPPANGTIDVIFTSGSTATVLTIPNTVKLPGWFNSASLDTSTIYEIMITDGVYGSVMAWAAT